jgi:hypothetical protein
MRYGRELYSFSKSKSSLSHVSCSSLDVSCSSILSYLSVLFVVGQLNSAIDRYCVKIVEGYDINSLVASISLYMCAP